MLYNIQLNKLLNNIDINPDHISKDTIRRAFFKAKRKYPKLCLDGTQQYGGNYNKNLEITAENITSYTLPESLWEKRNIDIENDLKPMILISLKFLILKIMTMSSCESYKINSYILANKLQGIEYNQLTIPINYDFFPIINLAIIISAEVYEILRHDNRLSNNHFDDFIIETKRIKNNCFIDICIYGCYSRYKKRS